MIIHLASHDCIVLGICFFVLKIALNKLTPRINYDSEFKYLVKHRLSNSYITFVMDLIFERLDGPTKIQSDLQTIDVCVNRLICLFANDSRDNFRLPHF